MAKFSDAFLQGLRGSGQRGSPTDPALQRADQYGSSNPLAKSIGGMFGMQMDTGTELASKELRQIDQKSPDALIQALGVQAKYEQDPQKKVLYMAEIAKIQQLEAAKKQKQTESSAFKTSLVTALTKRNQTSLADIVSKIPNFENLPAEAQNRILSAAGITDPEDQKKAVSTYGKVAADMGFIPGTAAFNDKVAELNNVGNQANVAEGFKAIHGAVKDTVDLQKSIGLNDAVTALNLGGKAGAETLQVNAILELFGNPTKANAAVIRFGESASIPRRVVDSVSKWSLGKSSAITLEDREYIVYAALQMQKQALDGAVANSATALNIKEDEARAIRDFYNSPKATTEWEKRFEAKYYPKTEKKESPPKSSAADETAKRKAALIDLERRRRATQSTPPR